MKLIYRIIVKATTFVAVVLFLALTLVIAVAPRPAAAVISKLFRLDLESPFWTAGGGVFLGGAILWVGSLLLLAGGASWLYAHLRRGVARRPEGEASSGESAADSAADVALRQDAEPTLEPPPIPAGSQAGRLVTPKRGGGLLDTPLNLQEVDDESEHSGLHRRNRDSHRSGVHIVRPGDRTGSGGGIRRL